MRAERPLPFLLLALLLGLGAAGAKLLYSFFPLFNLWDVLLFALLGWSLGRRSESPGWLLVGLALGLPAALLSAYFVAQLGFPNLWQGIGTGWLLSVLLIPLAAAAGTILGRRTASHPQTAA